MVKNHYIVAASDTAGNRWKAENHRSYARLLSHALMLGIIVSGTGLTVAQAHQAPVRRVQVVLAAATTADTPADPIETWRTLPAELPADKPPAPPPPRAVAPPTPPPAPRPVAIPVDKQAIADIIRKAAAKWGANPEQLLRVANCESHFNPNSYNRSSGASGLFQFKPSTYAAHGGKNIWDPVEQADVAAKMFSQGLARQWSCK